VTLVPALSERESINWGAPLGTLEAAMTGGATSTCPWTFRKKVRNYEYKTLRYPGHYDKIEAFRDLGLFDSHPVEVNGSKVVPKDFFIKVVGPRLQSSKNRDLLVLRVLVRGKKNGKAIEVIQDVLEYADPKTNFSAMQRTTGFSAAIVLEMLAQRQIAQTGVVPLEKAVPARLFLQEIKKRNIKIKERIQEI
jgi:lysine 6-dehydrogenase